MDGVEDQVLDRVAADDREEAVVAGALVDETSHLDARNAALPVPRRGVFIDGRPLVRVGADHGDLEPQRGSPEPQPDIGLAVLDAVEDLDPPRLDPP
jgi:hypothetical protein